MVTKGGCTDADMTNYEKHNKVTDGIMTLHKGKDWYQRFEKSADSLYNIGVLAESIVEKDFRGRELIAKMKKDTSLHFYAKY